MSKRIVPGRITGEKVSIQRSAIIIPSVLRGPSRIEGERSRIRKRRGIDSVRNNSVGGGYGNGGTGAIDDFQRCVV
ncbi:hypothetical protein M569_15806 [Genlisea aurea]|uniref:Uncharacterized protein n=1 Tax=Genlisea aurea TaxID=192259 RepID=S8C3P8_9LAMI|nr:hypothetical protein M569_15806 [Genlisea aurea]